MNLCAITGASGVLGRKIRKHLPFKFYCFNKNITNYKEVNKWVAAKNFDLIIHLAAIVPTRKVNKNYLKAKKVNVNGTENLINALLKKKKKPEWLFFASTSHVYGIGFKDKKLNEKTKINPNNKYGTSKKMAESVIQKKLKNSLCLVQQKIVEVFFLLLINVIFVIKVFAKIVMKLLKKDMNVMKNLFKVLN